MKVLKHASEMLKSCTHKASDGFIAREGDGDDDGKRHTPPELYCLIPGKHTLPGFINTPFKFQCVPGEGRLS